MTLIIIFTTVTLCVQTIAFLLFISNISIRKNWHHILLVQMNSRLFEINHVRGVFVFAGNLKLVLNQFRLVFKERKKEKEVDVGERQMTVHITIYLQSFKI